MNAEQASSALAAFAALVGGGPRSHALNGLAQLFEGLGSAKVSKIVATIEDNWKFAHRTPRYPAELKRTLNDLHRAFVCSGANAQAKAVADLLRLCAGANDQSLEAFVLEAIAARAKRSHSRGASRARTTLTADEARKLADKLASAADDRKRFDTLLDELKRQLKVAELKTIAGLYTGYEATEAKKEDIVRAIRHWHRQDELNRDRRASQAKTGL